MYHQTIVKPNAEEVAIAATEWLIETIRESIAARGTCSIALSGGSTPKRLYQLIAENETKSVDWSCVTLIMGDERNVPHQHVDSNFRMVKEAWLDRLDPSQSQSIPQMLPVVIDVNAPERAAAEYEKTIRESLLKSSDDRDAEIPAIDIVLLGLGDDAHTASLFPETEALNESHHLFVANFVPKFSAYRLTLTAPMINAARNIAFLVCGPSKRPAVDVVMHGPRHPDEYPAQLIEPKLGRLWWFLDTAAATEVLK
ncbi:MAG: 6-phosphogluconolactonase [Planctomycetota bacterium]|nr:6-phosphogluconolactonase [Planctomycetota bacterium]